MSKISVIISVVALFYNILIFALLLSGRRKK